MLGYIFEIQCLVLAQLHEMGDITPHFLHKETGLGEIRLVPQFIQPQSGGAGTRPKSQAGFQFCRPVVLSEGPSLCLSFHSPSKTRGCLIPGDRLTSPLRSQLREAPAQAQWSPKQGGSGSMYEAVCIM